MEEKREKRRKRDTPPRRSGGVVSGRCFTVFVGHPWRPRQDTFNFASLQCRLGGVRMNSWLRMSGPLLDPSKVPWRDFRSLACPLLWSRGFNHRSSGFCSSVAFGNPCLCLRSFADVPTHLIFVPLSCSVSVGRSVGAPRIFAGERSSSGLSGGRGSGHNQRSSPGYGFFPMKSTTALWPPCVLGCAVRHFATVNGAVLNQARRCKERIYPE